MKIKLTLVLSILALTFSLTPLPAQVSTSCSSYCSRVRCAGDQICGLYVNSSGQTVCGCHPR